MDKRDAAFTLFQEGYTGKHIAKVMGVTEQTVSSWKKSDKWDEKVANHKQLWESNAEKVMKLISYQLRALERKVTEWEDEGSNQLIGKGEIDALSKLYATIKTKEMTWANHISVMKAFVEFLSRENFELAKQLTEPVDLFLNEIREQL